MATKSGPTLVALGALCVGIPACHHHPPAGPDAAGAPHQAAKAAPAKPRRPAASSAVVMRPGRLSPTCRAALERGVERARSAWRARAKARGFTDKALDDGEAECSRRLHTAPALYQTVQATLDADQCVPQLVVRIEPAPAGTKADAAWKAVGPAPSWFTHLFKAAMPVVAPRLFQRSHGGLTSSISAEKKDLPALEKIADACMQ